MQLRIATTLALCGLATAPLADAASATFRSDAGQVQMIADSGDRNAALDYWRLMTVEPQVDETAERVGDVLRLMHPGEDSGEASIERPEALLPAGELHQALAELSDFLDDLDRATREPSCDFEVRYEDGYAALLPHLAGMRKLGRLLVIDARRHALEGNTLLAAERLAASMRLARHASGDQILISSLVSAAIADKAILEAHWLLDRTGDAADVRRVLREALTRLPPSDPYRVKAALKRERDLVAQLARQFRGPTAGADFAEVFVLPDDPTEAQIRGMDAQAFRAAVDRAVDSFDPVLEAWDGANAPEELQAIAERIRSGEFGWVAMAVVPAFGRSYERNKTAVAQVDRLRERVE